MFLLTFIKKIHYKHHDSSFSIFQRYDYRRNQKSFRSYSTDEDKNIIILATTSKSILLMVMDKLTCHNYIAD